MSRDEINHMSYGCGTENVGNVLSWMEMRQNMTEKSCYLQNSPTCIERYGKLSKKQFPHILNSYHANAFTLLKNCKSFCSQRQRLT